jgi:hypothetical protein
MCGGRMQFSGCKNGGIDGWYVAISMIFEQYPIMAHRVLAKVVGDSSYCRSADHALAGVVLPILPLFPTAPTKIIQMTCMFWDSQLRKFTCNTVLYRYSGRCWRDEVSSSIAPSTSTATKLPILLAALSLVPPSFNTHTICTPLPNQQIPTKSFS